MRRLILSFLLFLGLAFGDKLLVIDIDGMYCRMCPIAIRKAILKVKGVKWVKTSLKNEMAVVVTEDNVKEEEVLRAIRMAGNYDGKIIGETKL